MPDKIRPNQNQRSSSVPVDDEVEAVIVIPYVFNSTTGQYDAQSAGGSLVDVTDRAARLVGKVQLDQSVSNYISPSTAQDVANGRFFLSGTGRLSLAAAGNVRCTIQNPVGSGKTISIIRIAGLSTGTGWASLYVNPTNGLPVPARIVSNAVMGGGLPPIGVVRADVDLATPLSGGLDTGLVLGIPANSRVSIDGPPFVLGQGVTLGINIPFAGAADAALSVYWREL